MIETWRYGDVTNRKRWILVGFLKDVCHEYGRDFSFPLPSHDESNVPCAMHVAVPDSDVPESYTGGISSLILISYPTMTLNLVSFICLLRQDQVWDGLGGPQPCIVG